jgi:RNA polymerase sigma factor for flagellar operon FliA
MLAEHIGLVHFVARHVARGLRSDVEFDELVSAGTLGLIAAVDSFDASRGLAFSTFATPRVRGAMIDELRRQDHVPRSVRRKTRDLKAAQEKLGREGSKPPSDRETAAQLGIDIDTLWKWQADVESAVLVPLDNSPTGDDGGVTEAEMLGGVADDDIEQRVTLTQEVEVLRDAILTL